MARMFPEAFPPDRTAAPTVAAAERRAYERLARELDAEWSVVYDCELRAGGERGTVDFVLIHRHRGIALLGIGGEDAAAPDRAVAAMRAMLREIGFTARFVGDLPIVAATLLSDAPGAIADRLFK